MCSEKKKKVRTRRGRGDEAVRNLDVPGDVLEVQRVEGKGAGRRGCRVKGVRWRAGTWAQAVEGIRCRWMLPRHLLIRPGWQQPAPYRAHRGGLLYCSLGDTWPRWTPRHPKGLGTVDGARRDGGEGDRKVEPRRQRGEGGDRRDRDGVTDDNATASVTRETRTKEVGVVAAAGRRGGGGYPARRGAEGKNARQRPLAAGSRCDAAGGARESQPAGRRAGGDKTRRADHRVQPRVPTRQESRSTSIRRTPTA